jgi:transcriptional regulator GlxA family with amidase domain
MSGQLLRIQNWEKMAREACFRPSVMAAMCPTSLRQLERHFADQFDTTPGKWSRKLRLRLARELLAKGWANKAIAAELGFTDSSHLCRHFKKMCGASPQSLGPIFEAKMGGRIREQPPVPSRGQM